MKNLELTPWFSGDTPPIRPGVYERERLIIEQPRYALFDGKTWWIWASNPEQAAKNPISPSAISDKRRWRGILNPSES
jgi:hypothetical protein